MKSDKSLCTSVKTTLYQREKLADKIQFLLPQMYDPGGINIRDCTVLLKYVDQGNVAHSEKLIMDDELYKDKIRCTIDVGLDLTRFAGNIKCHLEFLKLNTDQGLYETVLSSGETIITINPLDDYFAFVADESLDVINRSQLELEAKLKGLELLATTYDTEKADNLVLDLEKASIYLQSNGKQIEKSTILLNDLGNAISDETESGLVQVITEDEIEVPDNSNTGTSVKYTLQLNQETDELLLLANGVIVSIIPTKDIGESIIDSSSDGLNEVITE